MLKLKLLRGRTIFPARTHSVLLREYCTKTRSKDWLEQLCWRSIKSIDSTEVSDNKKRALAQNVKLHLASICYNCNEYLLQYKWISLKIQLSWVGKKLCKNILSRHAMSKTCPIYNKSVSYPRVILSFWMELINEYTCILSLTHPLTTYHLQFVKEEMQYIHNFNLYSQNI